MTGRIRSSLPGLSARAMSSRAKGSTLLASISPARRFVARASKSSPAHRPRFRSARTTSRFPRRNGRTKMSCRQRWCGRAFSVATGTIWLKTRKESSSANRPPEASDPKWKGKIVKAHPGYSGTIMTATFQMARDLGWEYFEKLAQQNILQVQSAADPPKKIALGERAVQADGVEYLILQGRESGQPVEPVYATEGNPLVIGPNGLFKAAPNPNAARLFQSFCFSPECQQLCIDIGGLRSVHPQTKEHAGRTPLSQIKTMKDDPAAVLKNGEQIKARYTKIFRV